MHTVVGEIIGRLVNQTRHRVWPCAFWRVQSCRIIGRICHTASSVAYHRTVRLCGDGVRVGPAYPCPEPIANTHRKRTVWPVDVYAPRAFWAFFRWPTIGRTTRRSAVGPRQVRVPYRLPFAGMFRDGPCVRSYVAEPQNAYHTRAPDTRVVCLWDAASGHATTVPCRCWNNLNISRTLRQPTTVFVPHQPRCARP